MDILRVLSTPDLEVRKKTLQLALDLVSSRNVEEVSGMQCIYVLLLLYILAWTQKNEYTGNIVTSICFPVGDCFEEGGDQDKQRNRTWRHW